MAMDRCVKETLSNRTHEYCQKGNNRYDPLCYGVMWQTRLQIIFLASVGQPTDRTFSAS
jgi:hypothetical protein